MGQSFATSRPEAITSLETVRRRVLVTGAAGNIGSYFAEHSYQKYDLRLMVMEMDEDAKALQRFGEVVEGDISHLDRIKDLCQGIDTVVHLAANPSPSAVWQELLQTNIVGTYNVYVAAKAAGCHRVLYASSIHAVSGYPPDFQVKTNEPVNPGDMYGVTKCFGEAMGRYMAEQEGLSVIAIRIGGFQPVERAQQEDSVSMLDAFVSWRDLHQLIERCIDVEHITFAILHGISDNRFKRLDISDARTLVGYQPQDDLTEHNPRLRDLKLGETISVHSMQDDQQRSGIREDV